MRTYALESFSSRVSLNYNVTEHPHLTNFCLTPCCALRFAYATCTVADMQSFIHENWTSAKARHKDMPTSEKHWTRSQMKRSSLLAVHSRPIPSENEDDVADQVCMRRKKLADAWAVMQSCDPGVWTDVCNLYAMVVAVEKEPEKFEGVDYVLAEVAEAKALMQNAALLSAVKTIESYKQDEWKQEQSKSCVRRGSLLVIHEHHSDETNLEARLRHLEHAAAWETMKNCGQDKWAAACRYHEEQNKADMAKREKLDAACWVLQDFDSKVWSKQTTFPKSMKHASSLVVRAPGPEVVSDAAHDIHKQRLIEAWQTMRETDPKEWASACKAHEDFVAKGPTGIIRTTMATRNGVGSRAA